MHDPRVFRGRALARPHGSAGRAGDPSPAGLLDSQASVAGAQDSFDPTASQARLGAAFGRTLGQSDVDKTVGSQTSAEQRAEMAKKRRKRRGPNPFKAKARAEAHEPIDLTEFLVEDEQENPAIASLRSAGGTVVDEATQTDEFILPPPRPAYPAGDPACMQGKHLKRGIDADTQTDPAILWNFDEEVAPLLDVLVGKTLEQALLEVTEEGQLSALYRRRYELVESKRQEAARVRELEARAVAAAQRGRLELRRRQRQAGQGREAAAKVCALQVGRAAAQSGLAEALRCMHLRGQFRDGVATEIETVAIPRLVEDAIRPGGGLDRRIVSRAMVDELIREALRKRAARRELHLRARVEATESAVLGRRILLTVVVSRMEAAAAGGEEDEEGEGDGGEEGEAEDEEDEAGDGEEEGDGDGEEDGDDDDEGTKAGSEPGDVVVGPIELSRTEAVGDVLARIQGWVTEKLPRAESARLMRGRLLRLAHRYLKPVGSKSAADVVAQAAVAAGQSEEEAREAAASVSGAGGEGPLVLPETLQLRDFTPLQLRGLVLLNLPDPGYEGEEDAEGGEGEGEEDDEDDE